MKAEIISVGTELLLGHTINSDAALIARELASLGLDLEHVQTVGDNRERLIEALSLALARADIVLTSGGLGPTRDDLTKDAAADVAGVPLVEHAESLARLKEYFGSRPMSENQTRQAWLPKGATVFPNPLGTAPGCAIPANDGKWIILLPGPPRELGPMLENQVRPFLGRLSGACIHSDIIRCFGIGEGAAAMLIDDLVNGANPSVATYAGEGEMFVKVSAKAASRAEAEELCRPVSKEIRQRLGDVVYGLNTDSLEKLVVGELAKSGKTLATAESCTGGLLAKRITDIPGSSAVFRLGVVSYSNEEKEMLLGVPGDMLLQYGAVSEEVARSMAENVRRLDGCDLGIGITGVAGPDGGSEEKPLGLVHIALAFEGGLWLRAMRPQGRYLGRAWVRRRASSHALDMLRRHLAGLAPEPAGSF